VGETRERALDADPRQDIVSNIEGEMESLGTGEERGSFARPGKGLGSDRAQVAENPSRIQAGDLQAQGVAAPPGEQAEGVEKRRGRRDRRETARDAPPLGGAQRSPVERGQQAIEDPLRRGFRQQLGTDGGDRKALRLAVEIEFQPDRGQGAERSTGLRPEPEEISEMRGLHVLRQAPGLRGLQEAHGEVDHTGAGAQASLQNPRAVARQVRCQELDP